MRAIEKKGDYPARGEFPFSLPIMGDLEALKIDAVVTFFVGENGSGKSTLLEAIAVGLGAVVVGSEDVGTDASLGPARKLAHHLKFVRNRSPKHGFFFRAEDFFGFVKGVKRSMEEFQDLEDHYDETLEDGYGKMLAMGAARKSRGELARRYGENPHAFSHGESFINMFESRLVPGGLYLLDEPETPLSPLRQLGLLSLIKGMADRDCQFIIATHSPILMAFPGARIFDFDSNPPVEVPYDEVEHVSLTRDFLRDPEEFIRRL